MPATLRNILLVIANTEYGGGQKTFELLARTLGHDVAFHVACDPQEPFWSRMGELGVCRHAVSFARPADPRQVMQLVRLIREEQIDLVHSQSRRADLAALLAARSCRVPIIANVTARTPAFDVDPLRRRLYRLVESWMEQRFDLQIAVSETVRRALVDSGVPADRVTRIPESLDIDPAVNRYTREEACRQLGLDPSRRWVGSLGRFIPLKGYEVMLRAAAELGDLPQLGVLLAGEGPMAPSLHALAGQLGLGERVRFLPFQADPGVVYAVLDLVIFPSRWGEAFPRVLLEAMLHGKPVIASDLPACHEVLGDGPFAQFVPAGDGAALAAAIRWLWRDPGAFASMGERARRYVQEHYDAARIMPQYAHAYHAVLGRLRQHKEPCR